MLIRNINRLASSGTERLARDILEKIIEAGEAKSKPPFFSYFKDFEEIVRRYTVGLDKALEGKIGTLNDSEQTILVDAIAQHFIQNYSFMSSIVTVDVFIRYMRYLDNALARLLAIDVPEMNKVELIDMMASVHVLPHFFSHYGDLLNEDDSLRIQLFNAINVPVEKCLHDFHEKKILALAAGYLDKNSMFAKLPKEVVNHIGQAMNVVNVQNRM
jgi:hypothetical protein